MVQIKVKYFGEVEEKTGVSDEIISIPQASTANLFDFLKQQYAIDPKGIQIAVNQVVVPKETRFQVNDEIAILSPFAGG